MRVLYQLYFKREVIYEIGGLNSSDISEDSSTGVASPEGVINGSDGIVSGLDSGAPGDDSCVSGGASVTSEDDGIGGNCENNDD